jgi:hypothetical protein
VPEQEEGDVQYQREVAGLPDLGRQERHEKVYINKEEKKMESEKLRRIIAPVIGGGFYSLMLMCNYTFHHWDGLPLSAGVLVINGLFGAVVVVVGNWFAKLLA